MSFPSCEGKNFVSLCARVRVCARVRAFTFWVFHTSDARTSTQRISFVQTKYGLQFFMGFSLLI